MRRIPSTGGALLSVCTLLSVPSVHGQDAAADQTLSLDGLLGRQSVVHGTTAWGWRWRGSVRGYDHEDDFVLQTAFRAPVTGATILDLVEDVSGAPGRIEGRRLLLPGADPARTRAAAAALDAARACLADIRYDVRLERTDGDGNVEVLLAGAQSEDPGRPFVLSDVTIRSLLLDYGVEVAQASMIADPRVEACGSGHCVAVQAMPTFRGAPALVQLVARIAERGDHDALRYRTGHPGMSELDRLGTEYAEVATSFAVANGKPVVHEWTDRRGRGLRLAVTATWQEPSSERVAAGVLFREYGIPGLRLRLGARRSDLARSFVEKDETFVRLIRGNVGKRVEALNAVVFDDPSAGAVEATRAALTSHLRQRRLDLELRDVPTDGGAPGRVLARYRGPVTPGRSTAVHAARETTYLPDWDVQLAAGSRMPNPVVRGLVRGASLRLTLEEDGAGRDVLAIECHLVEHGPITSFETSLDQPTRTAGLDGLTVALPTDRVAVESVDEQVYVFRGRVALGQDGAASARRVARRFTGPGRELVLTVRVDRPGTRDDALDDAPADAGAGDGR